MIPVEHWYLQKRSSPMLIGSFEILNRLMAWIDYLVLGLETRFWDDFVRAKGMKFEKFSQTIFMKALSQPRQEVKKPTLHKTVCGHFNSPHVSWCLILSSRYLSEFSLEYLRWLGAVSGSLVVGRSWNVAGNWQLCSLPAGILFPPRKTAVNYYTLLDLTRQAKNGNWT